MATFKVVDENGEVQTFIGEEVAPPPQAQIYQPEPMLVPVVDNNIYDGDPEVLVVSDPGNAVFEADADSYAGDKKGGWSWALHGMSVFTTLCCCWFICISSCCGLTGLILAMNSYTDYKSGNMESSAYKRKCAIIWTLLGFILGLATLGVAGYFIYANLTAIMEAATSLLSTVTSLG